MHVPLDLYADERRFQADLEALTQIGATLEGGINRPAFSEAHGRERDWFAERAQESGLEVQVDGGSNHSAVLLGSDTQRTLLLGSHLDSVPNGGRFDGALGIVAGLEVPQDDPGCQHSSTCPDGGDRLHGRGEQISGLLGEPGAHRQAGLGAFEESPRIPIGFSSNPCRRRARYFEPTCREARFAHVRWIFGTAHRTGASIRAGRGRN